MINNGEKYGGQYVAMKTFLDREVVCFGAEPFEVSEEAKKKGVSDPVIFYVPVKGTVHIY
ncbi:MAG: DUF5678 domain-containing protein [Patescibacteria group bacterium]